MDTPKNQTSFTSFSWSGSENEVNEVGWKGGFVATEVVLFGKMR